jgi:predicted alpha-1,2-mannosidase
VRKPIFNTLPILVLAAMLLSGSVKPVAGQGGAARAKPSPADDVNTFVGTAGPDAGATYPGASAPFGMIEWSPDTSNGFTRKNVGSYVYGDDMIRGFSLLHLSGPGCPMAGDIPIQPWTAEPAVSPAIDPAHYRARFSHAHEQASPGYYAVSYDNGIRTQLTTTVRAGIGAFSFPAAGGALLFDLGRNAAEVYDASLAIEGSSKISGSVTGGGYCHANHRYTVYFAAEFNQPFARFGTWDGPTLNSGQRSTQGVHTGGWVAFGTGQNHNVEMRIALSYVSVANARKNLAVEIPGWNFAVVRQAAHDRWNHELQRISVTGGTEAQRRVFYTALYHVFLHPNTFNDANGEYLGFDNHLHVARGRTQYANYSGWDIYRTEVQLLALLVPKEASDMAQSLVVDAEQGGALPIWPAANDDACQMVGSPACPIIAGVYAFGARSFDTKAALAAMLKGATVPGVRSNRCLEWDGLETYLQYGYLGPDTPGRRPQSGPSQTLEYTAADFSIAQLARALGDEATYRAFLHRAQFWRNTFDTQLGYIEPRRKDGAFIPVDPAAHNYFVEGNPAQYSWMVPYNLRAVFDLMGGNEKVVRRLDDFFTELNAGEDSAHFWVGNEPVFFVPWAYDFAGAPWRTQAVVRRVEDELFTPAPAGEPGNDDLGAMSAWYVFAALGLYPVIPGVGGFAINSPLFPNATVHLGNGKDITVRSEGLPGVYVQSLEVNGKAYKRPWIDYDEWSHGAALGFKLGSAPNQEWGSQPGDAPPSFGEGSMEPKSQAGVN